MATEIINWTDDSMGDTRPIDIMLGADGVGDYNNIEFSDAADGYSNAFGFGKKARRRRQARRLERIRARQERRALRRQGRMTAMKERQSIRDERTARRMARKAARQADDEEAPSDAPTEVPQDEAMDSPVMEATEPAMEDSGYAPTPESETYAEEQYVDEQTGPSDEAAEYTGDEGFDGSKSKTDADQYWDDYFSADGAANISPRVSNLARRIEKNKEVILRLQSRLARIQARLDDRASKGKPAGMRDVQDAPRIQAEIADRQAKLAMLEQQLAGLTMPTTSGADGKPNWNEVARQRAMVRQAKRMARQERKQFIRGNREAKIKELFALYSQSMPARAAYRRAAQEARAMYNWRMVTPVDSGLNPVISPNQIVVPPVSTTASSFDGTGLIGLDNMDDIDAPEVRQYDLSFSNASGSPMKIDWRNIAIGVGVTVLGIWVYNKYIRKK